MIKISNIRIGTKLAVMSGLGVLLVAGMVLTAMHGNSQVRQDNEAAMFQAKISSDAQRLKAVERGMQVGVRDLRLAASADDVKKALELFATRKKAADQLLESLQT